MIMAQQAKSQIAMARSLLLALVVLAESVREDKGATQLRQIPDFRPNLRMRTALGKSREG
jgi:hypothetical protein